jgi:hypothetical protein
MIELCVSFGVNLLYEENGYCLPTIHNFNPLFKAKLRYNRISWLQPLTAQTVKIRRDELQVE